MFFKACAMLSLFACTLFLAALRISSQIKDCVCPMFTKEHVARLDPDTRLLTYLAGATPT